MCIGYGIGSAGTGIYSVVPSILLMFYMTNTLGVPVSMATLAILAPRILDFVTDPIMGSLSDRTRSRWGSRRPYLLLGGIGMLFGLPFLFTAPEYQSHLITTLHVMGVYICCTLAFTTFQIPYVALLGEIPESYHDRTRLNMFRVVFSMTGLLIGGGVAPLIVGWGGGGREGYSLMSLILGVVCGGAMITSFFNVKNNYAEKPADTSESIRATLKKVFNNRPFVSLLTTYIVQLMGMGCMTAAIPFFAVYVLQGAEEWTATIFIAFNVAGLVATPLWAALARRMGKLNTFLFTAAILVPGQMLLFLVDADYPTWLLVAQIALNGFAFGGQQLTAFSMLADAMAHQSDGGTHSPAATMSGLFIAGEKIGLACGVFLIGTLLSFAGLIETTDGVVQQSPVVITTIKAAYSMIPGLIIVLSIIPIWFYRGFERQQLQSLKMAT